MKKLFYLLSILSIPFLSNAQDLIHFDTSPSWCGTDAFTEEYFQNNPQARVHYIKQLEKVFEHRDNHAARGADAIDPFVIPVVVHVVHDNGIGNISLEQIQDAIDGLNEDYGRTNPDAVDTREEFQKHAAGAPFEFRLAKLDPSGNPTDGVVRVDDAVNTYNTRNEVKGVSYWNSRNYFNMWIVNSIRSSSGGGGTVLGFAQFPGSGSWNTFGLVMRHDQFGRNIGTSNADGRTLTHEVGHCLGLYHTFQSGCGSNCSSSGDRICDTPPVSSSTWSCDFNQNSCFNDQNGSTTSAEGDQIFLTEDYPDQIENYMSYDDCQNMFSVGQVDLMVSTMSQFSRLVTLVSQDNLDNTGVGLLYEADFESDKNVVCVGSEVNYKDMSFYGQRLWSWTLPGAQPENPNDKNPSVVYNTPGVYNARLSVSNGTEIRNKNKDNFVLVSPERGYWNDFEQDFEDGVFPSSKWLAVDETGDDISWEMVNTAASSGTNSIMLENYNAVEGSRDLLYTSTYDLSPFQSVELKLNYAFARKTSQDSERMFVAYSNDCGETWTNFWNVGSGNLATTGNQPNSAFVPVAADWKTESQTLTTPMLSESIQFRFTFFGDGGNNIYIDDFGMEVVWKDQPTLQSPASGETVNSFAVTLDWKTLPNADQYEYELASDNSFSNVIKTGTLNAIDINPDNADSEILAEGLDRGGLYFWRVRAIETGTAGQWSDVWFFRVSQTVSAERIASSTNTLSVYPNPSAGDVNLKYLGLEDDFQLSVRDMTGKIIFLQDASSTNGELSLKLDAKNWSKGLYFLSLEGTNQRFVERLVIR